MGGENTYKATPGARNASMKHAATLSDVFSLLLPSVLVEIRKKVWKHLMFNGRNKVALNAN